MTDDARTPDERALAALFASLVQDSPPSQVSPLEVVKLGQQERGADLDRRVGRLKIARNVLVAAVIAGVVVLVAPHLGSRSSSSTATSSSSSAAAASGRAPAAAAAPASRADGASEFSAAQSGSAAGGAVSLPAAGSSAAGTSSAASAPSSAGPAVPAPAASGAASSGSGSGSGSKSAPSSAPDRVPADTSATVCATLPGKAVTAVRALFPSGTFGPAAAAPGCATRYGTQLPVSADPGTLLTITVTPASPGSCDVRTGLAVVCSPVAGSPDAFRQKNPGPTTKLWVYGQGYQVLLDTADPALAASVDKLVAAGHAVIESLG